QRAAEELVDRDTERLRLDVPQRQLDAGDRLARDAALALPRHPVHVPVAHLDGPGIATHQDRLELAHGRHDAVRIPSVGAFAVTGQALVGTDGDELPRTPAGVDDKRLETGDLHDATPFRRTAALTEVTMRLSAVYVRCGPAQAPGPRLEASAAAHQNLWPDQPKSGSRRYR